MLIWHDSAWADYLYWQTQDKKTLKRVNMLSSRTLSVALTRGQMRTAHLPDWYRKVVADTALGPIRR